MNTVTLNYFYSNRDKINVKRHRPRTDWKSLRKQLRYIVPLNFVYGPGSYGEHLQQDQRDAGAPAQTLAVPDTGLQLLVSSYRRDDQAVQRQHQNDRRGGSSW
jgi:hypothetical protein